MQSTNEKQLTTDLKLDWLKLSNFKGIKRKHIDFDGQPVNIYGANESGKTTIADAIAYLLYDKDTSGSSADRFGIKTLVDGEPLHGVDHEVEAKFNCFTLKKVYKEKWSRKRGEAEETMDGHTVDYFIDGVKVKKSDYQERVEQVMSEELFKMLTLPDYFAETMHWTDRRAILTDMCGEIDQSEIIEANDGLDEYEAILDGKSEEDAKSILKSKRKNLNEQLDNIPSRIDENERQIEEVTGVDEAKEEVATLKAKKEKIEEKKSQVKSGGSIAEWKVKISEIEAEKSQLVNRLNEENEEKLSDIREKISTLRDRKDAAQTTYNEAVDAYKEVEREVKRLKGEIEQTDKDIEEVKSSEPKTKQEDIGTEECVVCERKLGPDYIRDVLNDFYNFAMDEGTGSIREDDINAYMDTQESENDHDHDADHEKYVADFNAKKADKLKELKEHKENLEGMLDREEERLKEKTADGAKAKATLNQITEQIEKANKKLEEMKADLPDPKKAKAYQLLEEDQQELRDKIEGHEAEKAEQIEKLDEIIQKHEQDIANAERVILQQEQNQKLLARIEELQKEKKTAGNELSEVDHQLYVIEQFERARSNYITDQVNDLFEGVEWRLFKDQINGGLTETCDPLGKNGVPFSEGMNQAQRIQVGLQIIKTLSRYYGKSAPILIDNRESVTNIPDTDLQVISLIVSPDDAELRVEKVKQESKAVA